MAKAMADNRIAQATKKAYGLDDPKKTKSTPRGTFRIKSKHITATMDSNGRSAQSGGAAPESGESGSPTDDDKHAGNFELRDVPYVQYFQDGYALHSAYWHDHFGQIAPCARWESSLRYGDRLEQWQLRRELPGMAQRHRIFCGRSDVGQRGDRREQRDLGGQLADWQGG